MVEQKPVAVYTTQTCPWCHRAKEYLTQKGIAFTEFDVGKDREKAAEMIKKSGQMGVPVITVGEAVIIGFNQPKIDELLNIQAPPPKRA
jgi:glutaredoxin 3